MQNVFTSLVSQTNLGLLEHKHSKSFFLLDCRSLSEPLGEVIQSKERERGMGGRRG